MNAINEFSSHLNSFAYLFGSINNLFCQVRWLEANLRNSSPLLLAIVGGIAIICLLLTLSHDSGGGVMQIIIIVFVVGLLAIFFYRRHTLGPVETDFQSILLGNNQAQQRGIPSIPLPPKLQRVGPTGSIYTIVQPHEVGSPSSMV